MTTKTTPDDELDAGPEKASTNGTARQEATKPLTVMLPADLLQKVRVLAVLRDKSISEIVADHVEVLVRRDLKKALGKLDM